MSLANLTFSFRVFLCLFYVESPGFLVVIGLGSTVSTFTSSSRKLNLEPAYFTARISFHCTRKLIVAQSEMQSKSFESLKLNDVF